MNMVDTPVVEQFSACDISVDSLISLVSDCVDKLFHMHLYEHMLKKAFSLTQMLP